MPQINDLKHLFNKNYRLVAVEPVYNVLASFYTGDARVREDRASDVESP